MASDQQRGGHLVGFQRVIVAGSRTIEDYDTVHEAIVRSPFEHADTEIVHGGADGVDAQASIYTDVADGCSEIVFEAEWDKYGPSAGPIRNERMADYADALIAVWDGESAGTKNMIDAAIEHGLNVYVEVHDDQ